ncbi:MAG TPA: nicotinate-nucleotide adenylyltransferase [Peptococcaceae bacterium]|jgi:nicotinate-nucleotide adenylyltransferase|nr:nicotinate-nucleotide adenylyltransferase [Clostridia bacterium]HQD54739.1 nicotinate-nucleotide adenylyltransferase [Peptococcaceae bacterium]
MDYHDLFDLKKNKRIGIMGGTFDPIHYGHLVTAETARSEFALEKVIFVPSGNPPHKSEAMVTRKEQRYLMTVLATAANPYFEVSRVEIERPGQSYAIDTVREFKSKMDEDSELYFITGADAIFEIVTWKDVDGLFDRCTFIAATRPGFNLDALREKLLKRLPIEYLKKIIPLEVPAMAISSTDIRQRIRNNRTVKYLLPEEVENFIYKNKLYRVDH